MLTLWRRVTHICVGNLTIMASDNGLSPDRRQVITWTNAGISLIGPLVTNFNDILIKIITFSFKKMRLKGSSAKRRPFYLGFNVLSSLLWPAVMTPSMAIPEHFRKTRSILPQSVSASLQQGFMLMDNSNSGDIFKFNMICLIYYNTYYCNKFITLMVLNKIRLQCPNLRCSQL